MNLENGKKIVINAPNNSRDNVYVQGLRVNGQAYDKTYLPHDILGTYQAILKSKARVSLKERRNGSN